MSSMKLDSVKSCLFCILYTLFILRFGLFDILEGLLFWDWIGSSRHVPRRLLYCNGRRSNGKVTVDLLGMGDSSRMKKLNKDPSTFGMNCINDLFPTFHLILVIEAGCSKEALPLQSPGRCFGENKGGSCSLRIVLNE